MMKKTLLSFIIILLSALTTDIVASDKFFNRHFIIVVDQTISPNNPNLHIIFQCLGNWLTGEGDVESKLNKEESTLPKKAYYDLNQDALSIFAFGLSGKGNQATGGDYIRIFNKCQNGIVNPKEMFYDIEHSLIHERSRYYGNALHSPDEAEFQAMDLKEFINTKMRELFFGQDPLREEISIHSGITLSHYVYPLIMDFISKDESANEYYLIIVSDFKSGQVSNNDQEDKDILRTLVGGNKTVFDFFIEQVKTMRAPFVQLEFLHFQAGDIGAKGTRILMKSTVEKSQVFISSQLSLSQSSGSEFELSDAKISFDKDPQTSIDSIEIVIDNANGTLCRQVVVRGDDEVEKMKSADREYIFEGGIFDLGTSSPGDVTISYIIYTMSHDLQGNAVLPLTLTAQQDISSDDIPTVNQSFRKTMKIIITILLTTMLLTCLILRGRRKNVKATISKFAQKYVDVTKKSGAVELPCWFYLSGKEEQKVRVVGKVSKVKRLSLGGKSKLYVRLQEAVPTPEEGFYYSINMNNCADFVEVQLDKGKSFSFNIDIQINPDKVNVNQLHRCSIMMDFMVESSFIGLFKLRQAGIAPQTYEFYFIEDLGRAWVGFDPGTSGSCMAIGNPSGELKNPDISMVQAQAGKRKEIIIPSKLILDKDIDGQTAKTLQPGEHYKYGIEAEFLWNGTNKPRYQSIKKLLGYKKSTNDMIEVPTRRGSVKFTGVDLAHLLVKGLNKDLESYISRLPVSERMRILGSYDGLPQRAVVAIPNNYTLPKILDMIDSIRRLGTYNEVRFIYEAEGVLFNYIRKTFGSKTSGSEKIIVYDMGGATINLTVFQIDYISKLDTTYYHITTLGKIGYAVGGDNIDVALMEFIFNLKQNRYDEDILHQFEKDNKTYILEQILRLKINLINYKNDGLLDIIGDKESFITFVNSIFNPPGSGIKLGHLQSNDSKLAKDLLSIDDEEDSFPFKQYIFDKIINSTELNEFVYSNVEDAICEIVQYPEVKILSRADKLIFAGRSTQFPRIKDIVEKEISKKFKKIATWFFDDTEIKTSVAYGACWYGIYNGLVTIDNSRLSSAYGFKQTTGTATKLEILLNQNSRFDEDDKIEASKDVSSQFLGDGATVSFYQIMGSGTGVGLLSPGNRHKVIFLTTIPVTSTTEKVNMEVDRNNNVTCGVVFDTGVEVQRSDIDIDTRDITEENDWAYTFATEDKDVRRRM